MPNTKEKLADVHSKLMGLLQRAPYIRCEDVHRQYAVNWLMNNGVTVQEWISVKDRLPEEKDGIFAHLYGTKQWQPGIHRRCSKAVIGCVKLEDGSRFTTALCTFDGEWDWHKLHGGKVTHWMPLPQPLKGE